MISDDFTDFGRLHARMTVNSSEIVRLVQSPGYKSDEKTEEAGAPTWGRPRERRQGPPGSRLCSPSHPEGRLPPARLVSGGPEPSRARRPASTRPTRHSSVSAS